MASLVEPNIELFEFFRGFPEWGKFIERIPLSTVRLDEVEEIQNIDLLKIDIQGCEFEVLRNGIDRLKDCLVIHTEVDFFPIYKNPPLYSEVEQFLISKDFLFHKVVSLVRRTVKALQLNDNLFTGFSQVFRVGANFVKDFTKFDLLSPEKLQKLTLILCYIYGPFYLSIWSLMAFDTK